MRPEIKAAIVVGAVVLAGGIIWSINSGRSAKNSDVPVDVSPADLKKKDVSLAGDKRAAAPELKKAGGAASPGGAARRGTENAARPHTEAPRVEPRSAAPATLPRQDEPRRPAEVVIPGGASLGSLDSRALATQPGERPEPASRPAAANIPAGSPHGSSGVETVLTPGTGATERPAATPPKPEAAAPKIEPPLPRTEAPARREAAAPATPGGAAPVGKLDKAGEGEGTYTIASGDTLAGIARQKLGRESRWPEIAALNPGIDPNRLREGQKIKLPAAGAASGAPVNGAGRKPEEKAASSAAKPGETKPSAAAGKTGEAKPNGNGAGKGAANGAGSTYKVERGETLVAIAKKALGDAGRWTEIYEMNRDQLSSPDKVRPGMELKMPARKKP